MQTQIVEQSWTQADVQRANEATKFDEFKKALEDIRLIRINLVQEITGIAAGLDSMVASRNNLIEMFKSEAVSMYPDLAGMDIEKVLPQLDMRHPLLQLWEQYAEKLEALNTKILNTLALVNEKKTADDVAAQQEMEVLNSYSSFQSTALSDFPTMEELLAKLQQIETIPYVDESSTIVSMSAIERMNPNAAAIVAQELASKINNAEVEVSDEIDQQQVQMQTMMPEGEQYERQGMTQQEAIAVAESQLAQPNLRKLGIGLAVVTLAFMIFKGNK